VCLHECLLWCVCVCVDACVEQTKVYVGDYLYWLPKIKQDVVFMDPPWGGVDYQQHTKLDLTLGKTPLPELLRCVGLRAQPHSCRAHHCA